MKERDEYGRRTRGPDNPDTTNPEPQWLRQDREQRDREGWRASSRGRERDRPWGEGDPGRDYDYGSTYGARGGYDNAYGGSGRDAPSYRAEERGWNERGREDHDDLDLGAGRNYAPFRVGTGMGMGTPGYGRSEFGSNYGSRAGWDLGTHQRDQMPAGRSYRGMGPQDYKRADERIRDDIHERLTESHHVDARKIVVDVNQGNVTLTGTVQHRRMRYVAEDIVESVMGVANIENQLRVQEESAPASTTDATAQRPGTFENKRH